MRIAAHVGVKDEAALLPECLAHLRRIGVSDLLVTDMGSTDGSLEWLEASADDLPLSLDRMDDRDPGALVEWTRRVGDRARDCGADWVLFLDADEFPLPRSGDLRDLADLANADLLSVDRFNVPPGTRGDRYLPTAPRPADYASIPLAVRRVADLPARLREDPAAAWVLSVPGPKLMLRPACLGELAIGAHDATPPAGMSVRRARPADLVIAHLPFTDRARFEAKVANVAAAVAANEAVFAERIGWHWRRWIALREAGGLGAEFERQCLDEGRWRELRDAGEVVSAARWFELAAAGRRP